MLIFFVNTKTDCRDIDTDNYFEAKKTIIMGFYVMFKNDITNETFIQTFLTAHHNIFIQKQYPNP